MDVAVSAVDGESIERPYDASQDECYRAECGAHLERLRQAGRIVLLECLQSAGEFSDRATSELQKIGVRSLLDLDVEARLPTDGSFATVHARKTRDPVMARMFDHLWTLDASDTADLEAQTAVMWIGQRLPEWSALPATGWRKPVEKLSPRSLALSKERLEAVGTEAPSLAELAALCGLSPHQFCRAFKAATGLPPHRYQIVARIERARSLLLTSSDTIIEIGAAVGYDDPVYFSRLFARETGHSPRAWRTEQQR